jgi:hypothetical protein
MEIESEKYRIPEKSLGLNLPDFKNRQVLSGKSFF